MYVDGEVAESLAEMENVISLLAVYVGK